MCGRIIQSSRPDLLGLKTLTGEGESRVRGDNAPPRYNGAPGQGHWVIRRNPETGERSLDRLRWGLIPRWVKEATGGVRPINAMAETITAKPYFRDAYAKRRCIVPIDGFFEWQAIKGAKAKQPFAIAMKDRLPFGVAGLWENWQHPESGEWVRTFAVITTDANELVATIHDRMPVVLAPADYDRWLGVEPDPRDLLRPYPAEPMTMWPVSTRVNSPRNDDASLVEPLAPEIA